MHTLWSATGASARITATQWWEGGGRWVNKCLEFIRGVHCDSYYTNIHACFSPPSISCTVCRTLSNTVDCHSFLCVMLMMFVKFQRIYGKYSDVLLKLHTFCK